MNEVELTKWLKAVWTLLTEPQQRAVLADVIILNCDKNDYIYRLQEESVYLYCMVRGSAKLEKQGIGERNQIVRLFQPGGGGADLRDHQIAGLVRLRGPDAGQLTSVGAVSAM